MQALSQLSYSPTRPRMLQQCGWFASTGIRLAANEARTLSLKVRF